MMPEMTLLPTGQVLIINGAQTGYAAFSSVGVLQGNSNADHAAYVVSCSSGTIIIFLFQFYTLAI
jgi:hypothetical protein